MSVARGPASARGESRTVYALREAREHRHDLCRIARASTVGDVRELTAQGLRAMGVDLLILDYDGVLAPHGRARPDDEVRPWLRECVDALEHTVILSNRVCPERDGHLIDTYPGLRIATAARKKPYPDGILRILAETGVPATRTLIVDDRLLTGCLAGVLAGCGVRWLIHARRDLRGNPRQEIGFAVLRWLERGLISLWCRR